jgi:hypothetical protein
MIYFCGCFRRYMTSIIRQPLWFWSLVLLSIFDWYVCYCWLVLVCLFLFDILYYQVICLITSWIKKIRWMSIIIKHAAYTCVPLFIQYIGFFHFFSRKHLFFIQSPYITYFQYPGQMRTILIYLLDSYTDAKSMLGSASASSNICYVTRSIEFSIGLNNVFNITLLNNGAII